MRFVGSASVIAVIVVVGLVFAVRSSAAQNLSEFDDVPPGHVAEKAIRWAVGNGITAGVGSDRFGVGQTLTRYEMVTFSCRAFDPGSCDSGTRGSDRFVDVPVDHWANYSVGWAVNRSITSGVSATEFDGSRTLTREQMITFLYRAKGSPSGWPRGSDIYEDVPDDRNQWADLPIGWAYGQGITGGIAARFFGFGTTLSREETVLFLCRARAASVCAPSKAPIPSSVKVEYVSLSSGGRHSCVIRNNVRAAGEAVCWGDNSRGQAFVPPGEYVAVSAGGYHSCAVRTDHVAVCWGDNSRGQAFVPPGEYVAVSAGGYHSCAVRTDHMMICWGDNQYGQADFPPPGEYVAISAGDRHSCAINTDGDAVCWGLGHDGQTDSPPGRFVDVSAGYDRSCGTRTERQYRVEADNLVDRRGNRLEPGQLITVGDLVPSTHITSLLNIGMLTVAESSDSSDLSVETVCWGRNTSGPSKPLTDRYSTVSVGYLWSCGTTTDGKALCWDRNSKWFAPMDTGSAWSSAIRTPPTPKRTVAVGLVHACGIRLDRTITCWGDNEYIHGEDQTRYFGMTDHPNGQFVSITASDHYTCAIRTNGAAVCWGQGTTRETPGPFSDISVGRHHACAVRANRNADCWRISPIYWMQPGALNAPSGEFASVSTGTDHSCAVRTDGTGVCWGSNHSRESEIPDGDYLTVSAGPQHGHFGYAHSCGITNDGTAVCWGAEYEYGGPNHGQAHPPEGKFVDIAAGTSHSCGLRTDRTVTCWGNEIFYEEIPEDKFDAIAGGIYDMCGIRKDGTVLCWGVEGLEPPEVKFLTP